MPLILGANSVSGYTVKNSLRFNSGSSDYLNRTPASTTNQKTYTISCWYKRTNTGLQSAIIGVNPAGASFFSISIDASGTYANKLGFYWYDGTTDYGYYTDMLFRDFSAWYHIVIAVDTTQATVGDRLKVYVNGIQQTLTAVYGSFTQNLDTYYNSNVAHYIGASGETGTPAINGYLSEFYSIDGQALTPSSFGETDTDTGIWKPKAYTGSFGTNGFYLEFKNSASLGTDTSGNSNTWTVNNLTSIDQSTDTPTNNFATLNPLAYNNQPAGNYITFSEGNLKAVGNSSANNGNGYSTMAFSKGKFYYECKVSGVNGSFYPMIGVIDETSVVSNSSNNQIGYGTGVGYLPSGNKRINSSDSAYGSSYTTGDIISVAIDADNGAVYFAKNGTYQNSGVPTSGASKTGSAYNFTPSAFWFLGISPYQSTSGGEMNFGSPNYSANGYTDGAGYGNFSYAVPSGYYALCTKNLAQFG